MYADSEVNPKGIAHDDPELGTIGNIENDNLHTLLCRWYKSNITKFCAHFLREIEH